MLQVKNMRALVTFRFSHKILVKFAQGRTQEWGFGGRNPSLLKVKAALLMGDFVRQLLKKAVKLATSVCLLYHNPPFLETSGCAPELAPNFGEIQCFSGEKRLSLKK